MGYVRKSIGFQGYHRPYQEGIKGGLYVCKRGCSSQRDQVREWPHIFTGHWTYTFKLLVLTRLCAPFPYIDNRAIASTFTLELFFCKIWWQEYWGYCFLSRKWTKVIKIWILIVSDFREMLGFNSKCKFCFKPFIYHMCIGGISFMRMDCGEFRIAVDTIIICNAVRVSAYCQYWN